MLKRLTSLLSLALLASGAADADVTAKAPDGFAIHIVSVVKLDRDRAWARLVDVASWWSGDHSYSQDAKSLSLDAKAGGCWCEIWSGGEVEHGRVVAAMPRELLRVSAALGPLQEMGVSAALTFQLADGTVAGTTKLTVDYKVSGSSVSGLDKVASAVDGVLTEQVTRLSAGK
jgi:hypothetical protein